MFLKFRKKLSNFFKNDKNMLLIFLSTQKANIFLQHRVKYHIMTFPKQLIKK